MVIGGSIFEQQRTRKLLDGKKYNVTGKLNVFNTSYHWDNNLPVNRGTKKLAWFFVEIWDFIVKNRLQCNHLKYCPSVTTTFSHLSGNFQKPSRKNDVGFDAIHESTHFSVSS